MKARHAAGKHGEPCPSRAERRSGPTTRARAALDKRNGVAVPSAHVAPCNSAGQPEGTPAWGHWCELVQVGTHLCEPVQKRHEMASMDCLAPGPVHLKCRHPVCKTVCRHPVLQRGDGLLLSGWGLPADMVAAYERRGLCRMFPWQRECLLTVLHSGRSLVYSAPTSAGKSLVAELLMLKRVLETRSKALMVLPFISLAREKLSALQEVACGIRVGGFMGQQRPPGGLASLDVAVCTIEKANGLVNRMLQEGTLAQLGTVVVDEVHLVGDPNRGYLLELMLAKLAYMARRGGSGVQVVAMSACLGNLEALARWLDAELYRCTERPVPLRQLFKVGGELWEGPPLRLVKGPGSPLPDDPEGLLQLCLETWLEGHAVLLFCPTRAWCEALALALARGARLLLARLHSVEKWQPTELSNTWSSTAPYTENGQKKGRWCKHLFTRVVTKRKRPPEKKTMRTNAKTEVWSEHLVLVPYQEKHVERYHEWMKDPHLQEMTASEPLSLADEYAMQKSWLEDDDKCTFIVLDRKQYEESSDEVGAMIGDVNLFFNNQDNNREAELEVMIAEPSYRGKGRGKEVLHLMMRYGIEVLHVGLFTAKIKLSNTVSRKLFESQGFILASMSSIFQEATYSLEVDQQFQARLRDSTPAYTLKLRH